jgi:hypothetical protein
VRPEQPTQYCKFQDGDAVWYTSGLLVKITDFGLSRIRLESGRVVYDKKQPVQAVFLPHKDVEQVCESGRLGFLCLWFLFVCLFAC